MPEAGTQLKVQERKALRAAKRKSSSEWGVPFVLWDVWLVLLNGWGCFDPCRQEGLYLEAVWVAPRRGDRDVTQREVGADDAGEISALPCRWLPLLEFQALLYETL